MPIVHVPPEDKTKYQDLLLLADEDWTMIMRYLPQAEVFIYREEGDDTARALIALLMHDSTTIEIKALAVRPSFQRQGYGRRMLTFAADYAQGKANRLLVGTGDAPTTRPFYEQCGFVQCGVIPHFFKVHYPHPIVEAGVLLDDMILLERRFD